MNRHFLKLVDSVKSDQDQLYRVLRDAWQDGSSPALASKVSFAEIKDAISVTQALATLPRVIVEVARDAAEPELMLTRLLTRVQYQPGMQVITGASGAVTASEIAEGQEYPEMMLTTGGSSAVAAIGKYGIAFKITDEMSRYGQMDLINMHIRAAGKALARLKEERVADFLVGMGITVFNNSNPTDSLLGVTHGRDAAGNANATLTFDDLFDLFVTVIDRGFIPNMLIMHPLTWVMFMKDPQLRAFAMAAGSGVWWGGYTGNPATRAPWNTPSTNGPSNGNNVLPSTQTSSMPQINQMMAGAQLPSYFLPFPVQIVTSAHLWFDRSSKLTDIIVCDSRELGVLIVDQEMTMEEWRNPSVDITKMKFFERYDIHIVHRGLAIAVARNIKADTNKIVEPAQSTMDVSSLPAIPAFTAIA